MYRLRPPAPTSATCADQLLEFLLEGLPFSYLDSALSMSDSNRDYRQSTVSGFAQDFLRLQRFRNWCRPKPKTFSWFSPKENHSSRSLSGHSNWETALSSRLTVNAGLRYDFYSNPTEVHRRRSVIRNPATDSGPTVGKVFAATPLDLVLQVGFAWNMSGDGKTVLRGGSGIFRDQFPVILFGIDRKACGHLTNDNVLYHSLSALASAEVNFWFTCRRKRLVARADGCGERCRMTFLATWASAYI
jgi:hypothetical protein